MAKSLAIKRLRLKSSLHEFVLWREDCEAWARLMETEMGRLSPAEVLTLSRLFLDNDLTNTLRMTGELVPRGWSDLKFHLREVVLGFSTFAIRSDMR